MGKIMRRRFGTTERGKEREMENCLDVEIMD